MLRALLVYLRCQPVSQSRSMIEIIEEQEEETWRPTEKKCQSLVNLTWQTGCTTTFLVKDMFSAIICPPYPHNAILICSGEINKYIRDARSRISVWRCLKRIGGITSSEHNSDVKPRRINSNADWLARETS